MSTEPTKIVYYPQPEKLYTPEELREVFAPVSVHDPVALALRQILQQRLAGATIDASASRLSEREAGHVAGRIQEIMDLTSELFGYMGEGSRGAPIKRRK